MPLLFCWKGSACVAEFTTLYSGSSGNCGLVRSGGKYLLIDMGKSARITISALKELGLAVSDCEGILVTHEHSDHVKGLDTFLKHYSVPVFGGADTLDMLESRGSIPPGVESIAIENRSEEIAGFRVTAFPTSHDVPCVGFRIQSPGGGVMAYASDLGTITPAVHRSLSGCDLVALEANYDLQRLRWGPYPHYLKVRIESSRGHLDNRECAAKLAELVQEGTEKFCLLHLSQENNTPALALDTVLKTFGAMNLQPGPETVVQVQERNAVSRIMEF